MRNNRPVLWNQGLFLTPQHLQQQDSYQGWERRALWRTVQPYGWGVSRFDIREEGLSAGEFDITDCDITMRDGTILRAGDGTDRADANAWIARRKFNEILTAGAGPMGAYIALPVYRGTGSNAAPAPSVAARPSDVVRFQVNDGRVSDPFDPDAPLAEVNFLTHNLVILFERDQGFDQLSQSMSLIKVAELVPTPAGAGGVLVKDFIPPCLSIAAVPTLMRGLRDLRDLLTQRGRDFAEFAQRRGVRATATGLHDVMRVTMQATINRCIPVLHHMTEAGVAHPEPVYATLREMVGEFSAFSGDVTPLGGIAGTPSAERGLPPYDHDDLRSCFTAAFGVLRKLIVELATGPEMGIVLEFDGEYFKAALPANVFEGDRNRYYLVIDSDVEGQSLWQMLNSTGKITSKEKIGDILHYATMGLKINRLDRPPEELPHRKGTYFDIDTTSIFWNYIKEDGNIAVYCSLDSARTIMKLYKISIE
jgi:type VI secretion system ImpJ/VasE family protein